MPLRFDRIGYWSELKLELVRKYAVAYSKILTKQPRLTHLYVDAFAGGGQHLSKTSREWIAGSPLNALKIEPPFREYHLIDLDRDKIELLRARIGPRDDVFIYEGDCNSILLEQVLPRLRYEHYRRGLVLLDPYGLDLRWEVVQAAGQLRTVDLFLNFPQMDMNRNVLWENPAGVDDADLARMTAFWGDASWREAAYTATPGLFGEIVQKTGQHQVVRAYCQRLREVAGFEYVATPLPMRNSTNSIVYYLLFASQNATAGSIIRDIFKRYQERGA